MKLQSSPYLSRVTPLLKRLVAALRESKTLEKVNVNG